MQFSYRGVPYHVETRVRDDKTTMIVTHGDLGHTILRTTIKDMHRWLRTRLGIVRYLKNEIDMIVKG